MKARNKGWGDLASVLVSKTAHEQGRPHPIPREARTVVWAHSPHLARPSSRGGLRGGGDVDRSFVGIDVSRDCLEVRVRPTEELPTPHRGRLCRWEG